MPHTKRSLEFKAEIDALCERLHDEFLGYGIPGGADIVKAIQLLKLNTTDSPCIVKAADSEPLFVLRAQDETSDEFVFLWAQKLRTMIANLSVQISDEQRERLMKKWEDALMCAAEMRSYPKRKRPD